MSARFARDRVSSKEMILASTSKRNTGQKNEKETGTGWKGVVNETSITF
jgi:hypothetical protein